MADAGDIAVNPFDIGEAITTIADGARELAGRAGRIVTPRRRPHASPCRCCGLRVPAREPIALVHFDAHLDTWDTYFGAAYTHGTPFRRAFEEGLLAEDTCAHLGTRGPLYARADLDDDLKMGFGITTSDDFQRRSVDDIAQDLVTGWATGRSTCRSTSTCSTRPTRPGTGTPEAGGLTSRELFAVLRSLGGTQIVGADVVEVAPAYDHAQITAVAASHTVYELVSLLAPRRPPRADVRRSGGRFESPGGRRPALAAAGQGDAAVGRREQQAGVQLGCGGGHDPAGVVHQGHRPGERQQRGQHLPLEPGHRHVGGGQPDQPPVEVHRDDGGERVLVRAGVVDVGPGHVPGQRPLRRRNHSAVV